MVRWEEWWCASCIIVRPSNALHRGRLYIGNSKWSIRYQIAWEGFIKIWHWGSVGGLSAERKTLFTSWRRKICERDCVRIIGVFNPIQGCSMWSILKTFRRCYILSFKTHKISKLIWEHKTQCQRCQLLKYLLLLYFVFDTNSAQRKIKASMEGTALI